MGGIQRVEGTLLFFLNQPAKRFGRARTVDGREVFLPGVSMRKELNGKWHHFADGDPRPVPTPNTSVVMEVSPLGKELIANHWALKS